MDKKITAAIEALDQKHSKDIAGRRAQIEAATKEVADVEQMLREAKEKLRRLQADHINASFAYDAERARLLADAKVAA
jgi:hypothetical protein